MRCLVVAMLVACSSPKEAPPVKAVPLVQTDDKHCAGVITELDALGDESGEGSLS
jgi:hypothetical protein